MDDEVVTAQDRQAFLLDISLFILEFLSPEKLAKSKSDEKVILEVPSAFVTMIWSSISGSHILENLIYAYLIGFRNQGIFAENSYDGIRRLSHATDQELRNLSQLAYDHILNVYAPLIEGTRKNEEPNESTPLLRRYEPILAEQTEYELQALRNAYTSELGIQAHPLYDLYYLQVYHAQVVGIAASPLLKRICVFFGRKTYEALTNWVGETGPQALNLDMKERYTKTLVWFINTYLSEQIIDKAVHEGLGLGISFALTGTALISITLPIVVADSAKTLLIDPSRESPYLKQSDRLINILVVLFSLIGVFICISVIRWKPGILSNIVIVSKTPTLQNIIQPLIQMPTPTINSLILSTDNSLSNNELNATALLAISPTAPLLSSASDVGYCTYVIQPGDTTYSVALHFRINESDLVSGDNLLRLGIFKVHQQIRVNMPCCVVEEHQGYSYTVQRGDTLFSIARENGVSAEDLASINNIYNPRYIQTGQMLCINKE